MHLLTYGQAIRKDGNKKVGILIVLQQGGERKSESLGSA